MTSVQSKKPFVEYFTNPHKFLYSRNNNSFTTFSKSVIRDIPPTGYHNLPVHVLLSIFAYFNENELRRSVIPVCHKWRQVALLPDLWRSLKFQGLHVPQQFICQQLRSLTNLQNVYFANINNATTVIRQLCRCNPHIITITLKNCKHTQTEDRIPERVLRHLVASCRKLKEINLKGTSFYGNMFYLEVALLPELRSINLSNNELLNKKNLFELVLNSQNLEELKLSYRKQQLTDHDVVFLFSNLKSTLKSITFDTMHLTDVSFKALFECEKLEKMYLYNASNMSPQTFVTMWRKLPELKYLKIHNCHITTPYFLQLFTEGKPVLSNLETINFACSWKLDGDGLKAICECCPNLTKVVLKRCKNLESVQPLHENCSKLKLINVAYCTKVPDGNVLDLSEKLNNLETLYVDYNRKSIFNDIKKNNKHLNVYIYLSEYNDNVKIV